MPPNAHIAHITEAKNAPYGAVMSFQYEVVGCRQGEKYRIPATAALNRSSPARPARYFSRKRKITDIITTQINPPSQPAVQPIFSPLLFVLMNISS
jgi:hypothetical protein